MGSGGAFTTAEKNYHSNILIYDESKDYLLFDAGTDIKDSLNTANIEPTDINKIFISHLHGDHCGGVEYIGFKQMFDSEIKKRIQLISDKDILTKGWKNCWSGTMEDLDSETATLETYFDTNYLDKNMYFHHCNLVFKLIENTHVVSNNIKIPSYGISFITKKNIKVYISGDTSFEIEKLREFFEYDLIFHECTFSTKYSPVHTSFNELNKLSVKIKKNIWLYHYTQNHETFEELEKLTIDNNFAGLVYAGQEFKI